MLAYMHLEYTSMVATRTNGAYGYIALHFNSLEFDVIFHQLLKNACKEKILNLHLKHWSILSPVVRDVPSRVGGLLCEKVGDARRTA